MVTTEDFDLNFYMSLQDNPSDKVEDSENNALENDYEEDEDDDDGYDNDEWNEMSPEREFYESDEDYEERMEDLDNFLDGYL